ncbi:hypothetical protein KIPB_006337, partial [Kipferlia bialata]|eukprot:g6337.t1
MRRVLIDQEDSSSEDETLVAGERVGMNVEETDYARSDRDSDSDTDSRCATPTQISTTLISSASAVRPGLLIHSSSE